MGWQIHIEVLQDEMGRIIGKVETYKRRLSAKEREVCQKFLSGIVRVNPEQQKEIEEAVSKVKQTKDKCNMVHLAGSIESLRVDDDNGFCLVDSGPEKKFVPCTVYKSDVLAVHLGRFEKGDTIQIVGYIRPWSKKVDDVWVNQMEVRITEIKNEPPQRKRAQAEKGRSVANDEDDMPF